jgi:hypothetical protein
MDGAVVCDLAGRRGLQRVNAAAAPLALLASHHRDGFAFEVDVRVAADVDGNAVDRASRERPGRSAGVVVGDRVAAVATDA